MEIPTAVHKPPRGASAGGRRAVVVGPPVGSGPVRQLLPEPVDEVDAFEVHRREPRERPDGRPWLLANMIASTDGATAVDGRSGGLGGPGDKAVFDALRASCDWVLVASGTATAERYRMPRATPEVQRARGEDGRAPTPGLAIVTASGRLDPTIPALAERDPDGPAPLVLAGRTADTEALAAVDAEVVTLTSDLPEPAGILDALATRGARVVLTEGGPRFLGILHDADALDELCLSTAPLVAGGESSRAVVGGRPHATPMRLARLLEEDDMLFARYVRVPDT